MNNRHIDVSVIVPCYNAERYLNVCLESLKAQKAPEIEIICIDDGSTDSTGSLLDAFAAAEPRACVVHTQNGGVSAARNRGIDMAQGRYIAFIDADDAFEENSLSLLYQAALHSGAQITSANHVIFDVSKGQRVPVLTEPVVQQSSEIVKEIIHMHRIYNNLWNKLYERSLFHGLRLSEGVRIGEDALLNLQLYMRAHKVMHLDEQTYVYRIHDLSAMAGIRGDYSKAHLPMLRGMSEVLLQEGVKELYFRDFLQSCVWIHEKNIGIRACMKRFDEEIAPLVLEGVDAMRITQNDRRLYTLTRSGHFPAFYLMTRVLEKITGKKWGIRR